MCALHDIVVRGQLSTFWGPLGISWIWIFLWHRVNWNILNLLRRANVWSTCFTIYMQINNYAIAHIVSSIPGAPPPPQKKWNSRFFRTLLWSTVFIPFLDRPSFLDYNNIKIIKFGWELFIAWVISYGLSFSGFAINRSSELLEIEIMPERGYRVIPFVHLGGGGCIGVSVGEGLNWIFTFHLLYNAWQD